MKPIDIALIIIIVAICLLAIRRMIVNKRNGKSCSGCCEFCNKCEDI